MDRAGSFTWKGNDLPTVASARAIQAYCNKYNLNLNNMTDSFEDLDIEKTMFLLSEMLKAGAKWEKLNGGEPLPVPSYDELMDEISLTELPIATVCVVSTMAKGLQKNIDAKPKNA